MLRYSGAANMARAATASENFKKVQRQKEEMEFLRGMKENPRLSAMAAVRERLQQRAEQAALMPPRITPREKPASVEPLPPPATAVASFKAAVRCIEPTHGGATLWTGDEDGCIGIRNGATGKLVYAIDKTPDVFVDALLAQEGYMWVGLSDGTIRIYDLLVYILAFESHEHSEGVTAFAATFDGKMFSASSDASIVKWDSEAAHFDVLAHLTDNVQAVRCLATYGYNLFVGGDGNLVQCLDTETGAQIQQYEGHEGRVNAVLVTDGYLFSGSEDGTVIVWTIDSAERIKVLDIGHASGAATPHESSAGSAAAVRALLADPVAHRLWAAGSDGVVHVWETAPMCDFALFGSILPEPTEGDEANGGGGGGGGAAVVNLKGLVAIDAIKAWSIGANGENRVWHAATNRVDTLTNTAIKSMDDIIAEDAVELAKWNELILTMEAVAEKLTRSLATTLSVSSGRATQRTSFLAWLRWVQVRHAERRRKVLASHQQCRAEQRLARTYLSQWQAWLALRKQRRHKEVLARSLHEAWRAEVVSAAWNKMRSHYYIARRHHRREQIAETLFGRTVRAIRFECFTALRGWSERCKMLRCRQQMADALARASAAGYMTRFWFLRWHAWSGQRVNRRSQLVEAVSLEGAISRALTATYLRRWMQRALKARGKQQACRAILAMQRQTDHGMLLAAYAKWTRFSVDRRNTRLEAEHEEGKSRVAELLAQLKDIEHVARRRKLLEDAQAAIDAVMAERAKKQARLDALREEHARLQEQIEAKRSGAKEKRERTVRQQVDDLIAQLKVKTINFHQDFSLIAKVRDRAKGAGGITRVFLEAHMAVKRVVIEISKGAEPPVDKPWPLTESAVRGMKSHHSDAVLTGIKTMVIAFDGMTPAERASLTTDVEIILNTRWIQLLADVCVEQRIKKLGKGVATRAK